MIADKIDLLVINDIFKINKYITNFRNQLKRARKFWTNQKQWLYNYGQRL